MGVITTRNANRCRLMEWQWENVCFIVARSGLAWLHVIGSRNAVQRMYCHQSELAVEMWRERDGRILWELSACDPATSRMYGDVLARGRGSLGLAVREGLTAMTNEHLRRMNREIGVEA